MHVRIPADGRGIAELARDLFDRGARVALRLSGAVKALKFDPAPSPREPFSARVRKSHLGVC